MDMTLTERNIVLVAHILAAVIFLGPVTVAASLFPRHALREEWAVARAFHRISRGYGLGSLLVPAIGLYLAARMDYLGMLWINLSLGLFVLGLVLHLGLVVPLQARMLASGQDGPPADSLIGRLRAATGAYGLIWLVILYLMVAKPT